jgi:hypothetical protein
MSLGARAALARMVTCRAALLLALTPVACPRRAAVDLAAHAPAAPQAAQVCGADGWCWYSPLPQGTQLNALWGSAWNDVWAGGQDGLLHFDGGAWRAISLPEGATKVRALWGSGPSDVWAGGDGLAHWDGRLWSPAAGLPSGEDTSYGSICGSGPKDLWVLSDTGDGPDEEEAILHWQGSHWSTEYGPIKPSATMTYLAALWSSGPGEVWVAGADLANRSSLVMRLVNNVWSRMMTPDGEWLRAIWGSGRNDVWAAGGATLQHWDGRTWSAAHAEAGAPLRSLWGLGPADVWASGSDAVLHWNGQAWSRAWSDARDSRLLRTGWSTGPRNGWAAGDDGLLVHYDGAKWSVFAQPSVRYLNGVFADSPTDAWAVGGYGAALHYDGRSWTRVPTPTQEPLSGVWARSPVDAFAVGTSGDCADFILHWDGRTWNPWYGPVGGRCLTSIWGTDAGPVWAVSHHGMLQWDGVRWSATGPEDAAQSVWASSASDVWVLQDSTPGGPNPPGKVYHWNGAAWTLMSTGGSAQLRSIWGSGSGDIWIAGAAAASLAHWDGASWSLVPTGLTSASSGLTSLWGAGPRDAWAAGSGSPILHWNGSTWSAPSGAEMRAVSGLSGSGRSVWAVGANGAIWGRARP